MLTTVAMADDDIKLVPPNVAVLIADITSQPSNKGLASVTGFVNFGISERTQETGPRQKETFTRNA